MPESDAHDSEPMAPATPRASGEVPAGSTAAETPVPASSLRASHAVEESPAVSEPGDTLLSAGRPADRLELLLDDRMAAVDARLAELDQRIAALEQKKPVRAAEPRHRPWLWIAFLVALAAVFKLLHVMR
jgi:hypothetical protein